MKGFTSLQILDDNQGRFGNQLFRVGTLIGQSIQKGVDYYIPSEWQHSYIFPNLNTVKKEIILQHVDYSFFEPNFGFNTISQPNSITEINGYFQSWKYFENANKQIKKDMQINSDIIKKVESTIKQDTVKLCIHVRWGDNWDRSRGGGHKGVEHLHPVMTLNYYEKSIEYILSETVIDEFFVFTDNEDTKEFIQGKFEKFGIPIVYCDYNLNFVDDFVLQSLCNHFIIANSTFSWWSAFLSNGTNKIVCCPNKNEWFGPSYNHLDTENLLPLDWVQINQK